MPQLEWYLAHKEMPPARTLPGYLAHEKPPPSLDDHSTMQTEEEARSRERRKSALERKRDSEIK